MNTTYLFTPGHSIQLRSELEQQWTYILSVKKTAPQSVPVSFWIKLLWESIFAATMDICYFTIPNWILLTVNRTKYKRNSMIEYDLNKNRV